MANKTWKASLACGAAVVALGTVGTAAAQQRTFNIPAESAIDSIPEFGRQAGVQITAPDDQLVGVRTPAIKGERDARQALRELLAGTGLHVISDNGAVIILHKGGEAASPPAEGAPQELANATSIGEVVVTGTHIRGEAPVGSALTIFDRQQIDQSGVSTVDQFARQMTQNFSGADTVSNSSSTAKFGQFNAGTSDNQFAGASFNLHGLGTTSTLTLLNGHRLAPAGYNGLITDISQLPLSAVDHIEVLTDGASAVYGADAVAGVINIVTRKDFDGAETSVRYGGASEGGDGDFTASQLLGKTWSGGYALLNYEFDKQDGLDASKRSYIPSQGGPYSLIPRNERNSLFLTGSQDLWSGASISAQALYSRRSFFSDFTFNGPSIPLTEVQTANGDVTQSGFVVGLDSRLFGDWRANVTGIYSHLDQASDQFYSTTGAFTDQTTNNFDVKTTIWEIDAQADGSLFSAPGGDVKAAIGGDYRFEQFGQFVQDTDITAGTTTTAGVPTVSRNVAGAFAEIVVPIIGTPNAQPWARRLEISGAVRYDHYSDFGSATNPKVGVLWEPMASIRFRASYGTSFRAPSLSDLHGLVSSYTTDFPDPNFPGGIADTLYLTGGNRSLTPERSRSFTTGFDLTPTALPGLKVSLNYFNIYYTHRIISPIGPLALSLTNPLLAPFITLNPSISQVQPYFPGGAFGGGFAGDFGGNGPSDVQAILDGRTANVAATEESGLDFSAAYRLPTRIGDFTFTMDGTRLIDYDFRAVAGTPYAKLLNTFAQPTDWKFRGGVGWTSGGASAILNVDYVNDYLNNQFTPPQHISSWTTADLYLSYKFGDQPGETLLDGFTIALSVQNLLDQHPPFVAGSPTYYLPGANPLPFDSANASAVGRFVALQFTKRW